MARRGARRSWEIVYANASRFWLACSRALACWWMVTFCSNASLRSLSRRASNRFCASWRSLSWVGSAWSWARRVQRRWASAWTSIWSWVSRASRRWVSAWTSIWSWVSRAPRRWAWARMSIWSWASRASRRWVSAWTLIWSWAVRASRRWVTVRSWAWRASRRSLSMALAAWSCSCSSASRISSSRRPLAAVVPVAARRSGGGVAVMSVIPLTNFLVVGKVAVDHGHELVNVERLRDGLNGSVG